MITNIINYTRWNPSCEATPFASEKWPIQRGEINTFMFRFTLSSYIYRSLRPSQGTVNGGAVCKWPRCLWDVKHNQTNKQSTFLSSNS